MTTQSGFFSLTDNKDLIELYDINHQNGPSTTTNFVSNAYNKDLGSLFTVFNQLSSGARVGTKGKGCGFSNANGDLGNQFCVKDTVCSQMNDAINLITNGNFNNETTNSTSTVEYYDDGIKGWDTVLPFAGGSLKLARVNFPSTSPLSNIALPSGVGNQFLSTETLSSVSIFQKNIPMQTGNYVLSFYHNGKPTNGDNSILKCTISIVDSNNVSTTILSNFTTQSTSWELRTVIFTVTTASLYSLKFNFNNTINTGSVTRTFNLAGVSLYPILPRESCGLYACKLVNLNYTGPVVKLRRNQDTTNTNNLDFYIDKTGTVIKSADNTTLSAWMALNSSTSVFVHTWYDQSGSSQHCTQTDTGLQPQFDTTTQSVYFNNKLMDIPSTILPLGNNPYSVHFKLNNTPTGLTSTSKYILSIGDTGLTVSSTNNQFWHMNGAIIATASETPTQGDFVTLGYNKTNISLTAGNVVATPQALSTFNLTQNSNNRNVIGGLLKSNQANYTSYLIPDFKIGYLGIYRNILSTMELDNLKAGLTATVYQPFAGIVNGNATAAKPTVGLSTGTYSGYILHNTTIPASFGWITDADISTVPPDYYINLFNVTDISSFNSNPLSGYTKCFTLQSVTYPTIFSISQRLIYFPKGDYILTFSAIGRNLNGAYSSTITKLIATVGYISNYGSIEYFDILNSGVLSSPSNSAWTTYSLPFSITSELGLTRDVKITYESTGTADNMVLITGVSVTKVVPVTFSGVVNGGFDSPTVTGSYLLKPTIPNWTYTIEAEGNYVLSKGTNYTNATLPTGFTQYITMQHYQTTNPRSLQQTLSLPAGSYTLSFYMTKRDSGSNTFYTTAQTLSVNIGSIVLAIGITATSTFDKYTYNFDISSSGSYELKITSNCTTNTSDTTILLTGVSVVPVTFSGVLYYKFNSEDVSGTTVKNYANDTYDATLYNGATVTTYLTLSDGAKQYVSLPNFTIPSTVSGLSISLWSWGQWGGHMFKLGPISCAVGFTTLVALNLGSGDLGFNVSYTSWHHYVFVIKNKGASNTSVTLYVDGVLNNTLGSFTFPSGNFQNNFIGTNSGSGSFYRGYVDEFRVYDYELSVSKITEIYTSGH